MQTFHSAEEILDFAVSKEEAAIARYRQLAEKAEQPHMRQIFEEFAMEEVVHREKLLLVKTKQLLLSAEHKIIDLRVDRYLPHRTHSRNADYQDALLLAMENEKASFTLYTDLAASTDDEDLSKLFSDLAQEEATHKLRFELEYEKLKRNS